MATFYTLIFEHGGERCKRYFVSEAEAKHAAAELGQGGGELIRGGGRANPGRVAPVEVDELIMRQWAASWANMSQSRSESAKKREAAKSPEQRSEIMRKAWAKRKEKSNQH